MEYAFSTQADRELNAAMNELESQLEVAERRFESQGRSLEINSIAMDCRDPAVLGDIVAESKRITDELYAAYESLIRAANGICKPLADEGVLPDTLLRVVEFMGHINSECSTLGSNFSASVNLQSLGNVVSVRYSPTAEARMIEANWKTLHAMHPWVIEEADSSAKGAAAGKGGGSVELTPELIAWKKEVVRIIGERKARVVEAQDAVRRAKRRELEADRNARIKDKEAKRDALLAEIPVLQKTIASAKFFEVVKKKEAQERIERAEKNIGWFDADIEKLRETPAESDKEIDRMVSKELKAAALKASEGGSLPRMPHSGGFETILGQQSIASTKDAIYGALAVCGQELSIADILACCPGCEGLSDLSITSYVGQMVREGSVKRVERYGRAYFRAV